MSFSSSHLLPCVITALFPAFGGFHRLAVDDRRAGFGFPALLSAQILAQGGIQRFPATIDPPQAKIVVDRFPRRQIVGHHPPRTAGAQDIKDAVEYRTPAMFTRSAGCGFLWQVL